MKSVWNHIEEHRSQDLLTADTNAVIERFTQQIIAPLIALNVSLSSFTEAPSGQVLAFQHFVQWKERMALERGHGVKSFFNMPALEDQTAVLRVLIRKQKEFENAFMAMADKHQLHHVQASTSEVGSMIDLTHAVVESDAGASALAPLTAEGWFELFSKRVDEMHQIELRLIAHMRESTTSTRPVPKTVLPARLEKYRDVLRELPLFRNVSVSTKERLLSQARVAIYPVAHQVLAVGQRPEYLQVVLSGWVKICSTNEKGDVATLQMIGEGDSVIDAPVYQNSESSVQAEVEQKSELLMIPAPIVRECLEKDGLFKTNALQRLAVRSQRQLQHIERARLKSAQERVGWFLLSLRAEMDDTSIDEPQRITLPYNKATIASYLDMTPETFSRILKSFRQDGVSVSRSLITVDRPRSLCVYCDHEMASQCSHYKTDCHIYGGDSSEYVVEFSHVKVNSR
jgi:CRP-like cAMP-binding protein